MKSMPLISVVTPFHNTREYLAECIESVLAQTYPNFEYVLSDNCSTDGSSEIAEHYARLDQRIRFLRQPTLLPQVPHYNSALHQISPDSVYCKMVQADDFIFPDCLKLMLEAFESSLSVGLVSAYDLKGNVVRGSHFPYRRSPFYGKEVARINLRTGMFPFGSPTTVMYRSSIVRSQYPFYEESLLHEDTEKCMQILKEWDFAFVHQVLSFLRVGNESISTNVRSLYPAELDRYIIVQRYASSFLDAGEATSLRKSSKRDYYSVLAHAALQLRGRRFWHYHRTGLDTLGEVLDTPYLTKQIIRKILWALINPGTSALRLLRYTRAKKAHSKSPEPRFAQGDAILRTHL